MTFWFRPFTFSEFSRENKFYVFNWSRPFTVSNYQPLTHLYYGRSYHFFLMFKLIMYLPQKNKLCTVFTFAFLAPSPNLSKANGQSLMFSLLTFHKFPLNPRYADNLLTRWTTRVLVVELHILEPVRSCTSHTIVLLV